MRHEARNPLRDDPEAWRSEGRRRRGERGEPSWVGKGFGFAIGAILALVVVYVIVSIIIGLASS